MGTITKLRPHLLKRGARSVAHKQAGVVIAMPKVCGKERHTYGILFSEVSRECEGFMITRRKGDMCSVKSVLKSISEMRRYGSEIFNKRRSQGDIALCEAVAESSGDAVDLSYVFRNRLLRERAYTFAIETQLFSAAEDMLEYMHSIIGPLNPSQS